ncbi:MAG: sigma-70 family RNA polymerase sigma factor [Bacteroidota bacterium]
MKSTSGEKQRAFEREALPHSDLLYNYALRMTNNVADAEDLVQETFLKAYRFWDSYELGTNIRAWLFRIMKNSYINRYRREVREPEKVVYDEATNHVLTHTGDDAADPLDVQVTAFGNLLDDEIAGAIASLPVEFRTVVILCDIEGLSYEEVADFMECPLGTVRSRLHRGRRLLRRALHGYARQRGLVPQRE